jgi:hypothetical protein
MPRRRAAIVLAVVSVPIVAAVQTSWLLTDELWYRELGHADIYWSLIAMKAKLLLGVGGAASVVFLATMRTAMRRAPFDVPWDEPHGRVGRRHRRHGWRTPAPRTMVLTGAAICTLLGFAVGLQAMQHWQTVVLWTHRSKFGVLDPIHHTDVGFFVFTLPLLEVSANIALGVVAIAGALATAVYVMSGALSLGPLRATAAARTHLAVLGALALVVLAGRLMLVTYSLEISRVPSAGAQAFPGAHYVDVRVRIPALQLIALLLLLCAGALVVWARLAATGHARFGARIAAWPVLGTLCVLLTSLVPIPWAVQSLVVDPQPVSLEQAQLRGAIKATGQAFSLADIEVPQQAPRAPVPPGDVPGTTALLANVQVWDSAVLLERMRQLASGTPYFRALNPTLNVDRVNGQDGLVVYAEQELDLQRVGERARGWENSRLVYTHGLGSFSYSASLIGPNGEPSLQPPAPSGPPRIYYGPQAAHAPAWVVVNTRRSEVDRPIPAQQPNATYHYAERGGISLSGWIRRTAFAIRLGDPTLLLSHDITPRSRIMLQRDVVGRLKKLAGFLRWDPKTTAVEANGRVVFLADGYTTSSNYPQTEPVSVAGGPVNYARASVRATVDALSGETRLYLSDDRDPIARAWAATFPSLFQPMSTFPSELRTHLRYPPALFDAQAQLYQRFHASSPSAFASGADEWGRPTSLSGSIGQAGNIRFDSLDAEAGHELRPAYRFAVPPGRQEKSLLRTTLFTPRGGENVVAELDGWIDDRGRTRLALAPSGGDQVTLGPSQISRLVFTTPRITNALSALNKETTDVTKNSLNSVTLGAPHWLRIAGQVQQVQPVYVVASATGVTRMLGVTVFLNGRAGIGATLADAVAQASAP